MRRRYAWRGWAVGAALSALLGADFAAGPDVLRAQESPVALKGARLLTMTGRVVEDGVLVMEDGRITALGSDVIVPRGADVVDVSGRTVMPGFIDGFTNLGSADYAPLGRDDDEATDPLTPHLRITDAIDPENTFIPLARESGVTAVLCAPAEGNLLAGQSALVRLTGESVEEMTVEFPVAVHVSLGEAPKLRYGEGNRMPQTRMGSAALLRQTLVDARGYAGKLGPHGENGGGADGAPPHDPKLEALLPVLRREVPLMVSADRFDDIHTALRIAREFDVPMILNHGAESHRVTRELSEAGVPVVWGPGDAVFRELESRRGGAGTPGALRRERIPFAFQTGSVENVAGLLDEARAAARAGLPVKEALKGLTLYPARIFGVDDRLGSLEVGKMADVVVLDGDPLDALSEVEMVFVGGERVREPGP